MTNGLRGNEFSSGSQAGLSMADQLVVAAREHGHWLALGAVSAIVEKLRGPHRDPNYTQALIDVVEAMQKLTPEKTGAL